jgi:microcystin degradation protein MlrC
MTVAIGGILTECNHFVDGAIDLDSFLRSELFRGDELLGLKTGVVAGMVQALTAGDQDVRPLLFASSCPGGPLTTSCYRTLKAELLERLTQVIKFDSLDGVLLPLHGAMVAEQVPDADGEIIEDVRSLVGPDVPIVVTLDLHAHVTQAMVSAADALVAWETYPHRDSFETGIRAANLLLACIHGTVRPSMAMAKVPVLTSAINGSTDGNGPFAEMMNATRKMEELEGVESTSLFLCHPYIDAPDMGSGALVVTNNDMALAEKLATEISESYWERRHELEPVTLTPSDAIERGIAEGHRTVLLVETADCCGGGAAGDSVATLRALVQQESLSGTALVPVVDAAAAEVCHRAKVGEEVKLTLGHQHDDRWGEPLEFVGTVVRHSEGSFQYSGGIWDGMTADMGPSAVVTSGKIQLLITTHPTYDWADEQYQSVGMSPEEAMFIVAKNPMNYQNVLAQLADAVFILDTPGPTPASVKDLPFRAMQRPFFPLDDSIESPVTILR